jgi:hypothetical protein
VCNVGFGQPVNTYSCGRRNCHPLLGLPMVRDRPQWTVGEGSHIVRSTVYVCFRYRSFDWREFPTAVSNMRMQIHDALGFISPNPESRQVPTHPSVYLILERKYHAGNDLTMPYHSSDRPLSLGYREADCQSYGRFRREMHVH